MVSYSFHAFVLPVAYALRAPAALPLEGPPPPAAALRLARRRWWPQGRVHRYGSAELFLVGSAAAQEEEDALCGREEEAAAEQRERVAQNRKYAHGCGALKGLGQ